MPINILMPALSPTMTEGKLANWLKKEGDSVESGDVLAEIETDKATMEVEAVDEGTLGRIVVPEGTEGVPVNQVIAVLLEPDEDPSVLDKADAAPAPKPAPAPQQAATPSPQPAAPAPAAPQARPNGGGGANGSGDGRIFASPLARRMAQQAGLALEALSGSGPHGRIVRADVEAAIAGGGVSAAQPAAAPAAPSTPAAPAPAAPTPAPTSGERLPYEPEFALESLSTMRKTIARRLVEAKQQIPHFYMTIDCALDALLALRKDLNAKAGENIKLSVNDLVIKAVALALREVPEANASWSDAGVKLYKSIDVAVAVALDGGLITPVVRQADQKGLSTISGEMKELAGRAREGKLMPEEYQGGTFSISNLGMFGIKDFAAVINPPQACILAVGAGEQRPVVKDGALAVATMMSCTLSVDHRAVDGAIGARFLAAFKRLIEDPIAMML
jgi:pyruvate dehydrogenase E2 component (dihydrolipoamide acetyltransferase)